MLKRQLDIDLPSGTSLFLWGARKTGKSTYLKNQFPTSKYIDLLQARNYLKYSTNPSYLSEELAAIDNIDQPIIIDEIQKVPALLDEIHYLIESRNLSFILCGSSMRKIKAEGANLLGGRAWRQLFLPLCYPELPQFNLLHIFEYGLLPAHYLAKAHSQRYLEAYIADYLIPEVSYEGQIRNLSSFARFIEVISYSNGEMLNYSNIARESGVSSKTVQAYTNILCEMFLGYLIRPFSPKSSRQLITATPKFYFFDPSLPLLLRQQTIKALKGAEAGHALENYLMLELIAYREIRNKRFCINYWRSKTGLEVDFILNKGKIAIEVKISNSLANKELKAIVSFSQEYKPEAAYVICLEEKKRLLTLVSRPIIIYPIEEFLQDLWQGKII